MKSLIVTTIAVIVAGCAATTPHKLPLQRLSLYGRVVDSMTGAPLAAAAVDLNSTLWGTFTDSSGQFELRSLPSGRYTVRMHSPCGDNRVLGTREVELSDTAAVRVDFVVALDSLSRCQVVWFRGVR